MLEVLLHTAPASAGHVLLWGVLGALGGLALGVAAALVFSRLGAFQLGWKHATWLRVLAALWVVAAGLATGAVMGGCEGTWRGTQRAIADAQLRDGPMLSAAGCVSAGVAWIDLRLRNAPEEALSDYLDGKAKLDVPGFYARLAKAEAEVVDGLVSTWNTQAQARLGLPRSAIVDALLGSGLRLLGEKLVRKALHDTAKDYGVASAKDGFFAALDETTGEHKDLAARLLERCVVPLALAPVRFFVRGHQLTAALLGGLAILLPVLGFWIGRLVERRKACTKDVAGAILPPAGQGPGQGQGPNPPGERGAIAPGP